ncbi:MAG: DUF4810 domain-containing protein [Duncaniella dubosii]|nr:DUF4810 domain-containing protein [Duncaniella dubosii]
MKYFNLSLSKIGKIVFALPLLFMLDSCVPFSELYSWHNYEDRAYKNSKKQTDESKVDLQREYEKVIQNQNGVRKTVPPGMFAEYGFFLYKAGKKNEGLILLQKEIDLYPESEIFISRIKNQIDK